jgi:hypothetical protein
LTIRRFLVGWEYCVQVGGGEAQINKTSQAASFLSNHNNYKMKNIKATCALCIIIASLIMVPYVLFYNFSMKNVIVLAVLHLVIWFDCPFKEIITFKKW